MTSSYMPIPSDSEDENDDMSVTALLSDSDDESYRTRSTERSHFFSQNVPESDDDHTSNAAPTSPIPPFHFGIGAHTIRTARKRVAMPRRVTLSPDSVAPTTDPYLGPTVGAQRWEWIPDTLQQWRNAECFPPITEMGESSTTHREFPYTREPPHHTTPILVARMSSQETRIDIIEDALMEMPGMETMEELRDQIDNVGGRVTGVQDTIQDLRERLEESTARNADLGRRMEHMEHSLDQYHALADTMRGYASFILRGDHVPK